ncbi:kinase-like domain-containing protein [Gigaspora rosea]|uniref:Kinase-like domain-containing protein n=1 Tax=Gigaspora rosea TaxID=44941 RepID=A0A397U909_9GLOM|nr:kinase-like domain-containing protein [Gigaspora rosea]
MMGRHEEAISDFNKLLEVDPNDASSLDIRGITYQKMGRYEEAISDFNKSLEIVPNNEISLNHRAISYRMMGRYEESLADLNRSLVIDPNNASTLYLRGITYKKMGRYEESLAELNRSLVIDPNNATVLNCRGVTYQMLGSYKKSLADYNESLEINPNYLQAINNRGVAYQDIGRYEESLTVFNKSLEIDPNDAAVLSNRGFTYKTMGRYEESLADLNKSLEIDPNNALTLNISGTLYQQMGRHKEALSDLNKSYEIKANKNIKQIGKGGFGTVYSATWIDEKDYRGLLLTRKQCTVALKSLTGSFDEFKIHYEYQLNRFSIDNYGIEIYGITYNSFENEYLMVFEYADKGDLRHYLSKNFKILDWRQKIKILRTISDNLDHIHQNYVHGDFHSGNILMISTRESVNIPYDIGDKLALVSLNLGDKISIEPKISDLGLSRKINETTANKKICGEVSSSAPEVLLGKQPTRESDIYCLGIIMSEVSTGKPPFENISRTTISLEIDIYNGLRPEFASGTPDVYIKLAKQCMDNDPMKRPTAKIVYEQLQEWEIILNKEQNELNEEQIQIRNQFLETDKIISSTSNTSLKHQDAVDICHEPEN